MAKTRAPLLAFGASGQIGKTQVYASWRGIPYARQLVKPANPNTAGQQKTRNAFAFLNEVWKLAPATALAPWNANASGRPYTGRNKFLSANTSALRTATDLDALIGSPGAGGGLAAGAVTATGGSGTIACTMTAPTLPTSWTITEAVAWAIISDDPQSSPVTVSFVATASETPYAPAFTDLAAGDYVVMMWFVFTKADGSTAYGPSTNATATVS
jgi:hypothetical protein